MEVIHGFELVEEREIPEINSKARLFRHRQSGAELLSMENADENKVFGITFRTPPADSTGIAHIMEHAVLCGSQKYPVKEPFVELVKGSLNTFVNAMTFPDKTCYPVASQNLQDFYNLVDVYVDAVLHPLIPPRVLDQEGWHYELDDLSEPLTYKGVVFNEMKGAYDSPDALLSQYAQESLFPDNTYRMDSGGDPREMPNLTYTRFKAFHETYYHPSNARIFFYGDDDPQERLRRMDAALQGFSAQPVDSQVALQPAFSQPRHFEHTYDPGEDPDGNDGMLVVNWLLPDTHDQERNLALLILSYILIGTPASPLRKALIDSGLGEDLAGVGLENDLRQMYFSTGMKGIADGTTPDQPAGFDQVEDLILATLARLAEEGIDPLTVEAALNTAEFRLRENNTGSFPRGLLWMLHSLSAWLYDGDPLAPLAFEAPLQAIKTRLSNGEAYFENLIHQYLVQNTHRTSVILKPEPGLLDRQELEEKEKLASIRAGLTPSALQEIIENTRRLKLHQETPDSPEALASIPNLKLEDLDRYNKLIPLETSQLDGSRLLYHDLFTNGIVYLDLGFDLHLLPQEYLPYISLFGRALLEMGTESEDFVQLSQRIGRTTGGIRSTFLTSALTGQKEAAAWMFLRGKTTLDHTTDLLAILSDVLLGARLDNRERFMQMVLEEKADLEASITPGGHQFVNARLRSFFTEAGWLDEQIGGVSYLYFLRRLADRLEQDWPAVLTCLENIRRLLVNRQTLLTNITVDQTGWQRFQPELTGFLQGLPTTAPDRQAWQIDLPAHDMGLVIPAQINFVGKGANLYELGYQLDGSYAVINNYLRNTWLWEQVRVLGGAYGAFCVFDHRSGIYTYLSYRDPNVTATLESYDQSGQFLRNLDQTRLNQAELTKSIIGVIGDLDDYQLPDAKGYTSMTRYLLGDTDEQRQLRREQVLSTKIQDFHRFGEFLEGLGKTGHVVIMGSEQSLQAANQQGYVLDIEKVM